MQTGDGSLIRRWFEAGDGGDLDAFDTLLHPDVVVHAPLGFATRGIEAEKASWRAALASVPDLRHDVQDLVCDGAMLAARVVVSGTVNGAFAGVQATGRSFSIDQATFVRLRDGKATEIWEIADTAAFLRQLGADLP